MSYIIIIVAPIKFARSQRSGALPPIGADPNFLYTWCYTDVPDHSCSQNVLILHTSLIFPLKGDKTSRASANRC